MIESSLEYNHSIKPQQQHPQQIQLPLAPRKKLLASEELSTYLLAARDAMGRRDHWAAEHIIAKALRLDSYQPLAMKWLYEIYMVRGLHEQANKVAQEILKVDYGFASLFRLAQLAYVMGNDQRALDFYFEALSVLGHDSENLFEIYKNMGNIYTRFQDYDAAEEYYNKAYTLMPESDVLFVNYGTLYLQKSEKEKASECFQKAVQLNRQNSKAWVGLAMLLDEKADDELAWGNIIQAFDSDVRNKTSLQLICQWSIPLEKKSEAIDLCFRYLAFDALDEEVTGWLIDLLTQMNRWQDAVLEVEKLTALQPKNKGLLKLRQYCRDRMHESEARA